MEEINPKYHLKIYIDNVNCDPRESVSCPRAIIVSYNSLVITLKNHNLIGAAKLEVRFNIRTSCVKIHQSPCLEFRNSFVCHAMQLSNSLFITSCIDAGFKGG